jgi:hypothetical protein
LIDEATKTANDFVPFLGLLHFKKFPALDFRAREVELFNQSTAGVAATTPAFQPRFVTARVFC